MTEHTPTRDEFVARYANADPRLGTTVRQREAEALRFISCVRAQTFAEARQLIAGDHSVETGIPDWRVYACERTARTP